MNDNDRSLIGKAGVDIEYLRRNDSELTPLYRHIIADDIEALVARLRELVK